ncbi:hypothetical protein ACGFXC_26795 [Streptomyces sp. NPDC048507]|uniref:hypothetical protein n=1 Tax=Streptomyces sp. NPDC048507 TaxID=3365560 RepID=UPI003723D16C
MSVGAGDESRAPVTDPAGRIEFDADGMPDAVCHTVSGSWPTRSVAGSEADTLELGLMVELGERVPCRLRPFANYDGITTIYSRNEVGRTTITMTARCTAPPCLAQGAAQDARDALAAEEPVDVSAPAPALRHLLDQVHRLLAALPAPNATDPARRRALWAHRTGVLHEALRYLAEQARRREPLLEPLAGAVIATLHRAGRRGYGLGQGAAPDGPPAAEDASWADHPRRARALSEALRELAEQVAVHAAPAPPRRAARPVAVELDVPTDPELLRCFLLQTLSTALLISGDTAERLLGAHEEHVRGAVLRPGPERD